MKIRKRLKEKVIELVDTGVPNFGGYFKDEVLNTCEEVYGRKGGGEVKEILGVGMKM